MVKAGEFSPPETIRAFLAERLAGIKELVAEAGEDTGLTLLQAIRKAGGISLAKETALKGEIKWMQEFRTSNFGTVRGVPGVFNDKRGLPIDGVMEAVQQNPEFASQFKTQGEFLNAVQRAAQKPDRTLDALKLLRSQTMREIDGMKAANAPPVVDADGDVRLPGDVGAVRAQEVKTPTFRAPQQASGGDFALGAETQFKAGDMVKLTVPTLNGPRLHMGTVTRIMPDGRVEVRMQQGGYETVTPADLTRK